MKIYFTVLFAFLFVSTTPAQELFSRVSIELTGPSISQLLDAGIDLSEGSFDKDRFFETDLSAASLQKLDEAHIPYTIIHKDVAAFYAKRAALEKPDKVNRNSYDDWPVPDNWEYGSMGGYYTLNEVMMELDDMHTLYPDLITGREPLSATNLTHDGRAQFWVKISDNPTLNEEEPEILYTGVHHAREVMGVQQLIYYMWYLLENYATNNEIKSLLDHTEMYFVPVLNPDGYEYNHETNPDGGGMWRKNRRDNGGGVYGVDINRNYGYMWGYNNSGSSPNPLEDTYRGPAPFSEPETQNIRNFCEAHNFKIALNYHSYSNRLLYPWGWTPALCDDDEMLHDFSVLMTVENYYTYGPSNTTIYATNGTSDDWMYGEQNTKEVIFAFTPEIGVSDDGFWPAPGRIIPLCQEQMWQNLTAARLVGKYASVADQSPTVLGDINGYLSFEIKRLGLADSALFTVSIQPLDDIMLSVGSPVVFENMMLMETLTDSIAYVLDGELEAGAAFSYLLTVDNGDFLISDTIQKVFGNLLTVFEDGCDEMLHWSSASWDTTMMDFMSPLASITDSPNAFYPNNDTSTIVLDSIINLTAVNAAFVTFWAKWEIESRYDYAQFMVRDVSTETWKPLSGKYTRIGTADQMEGEPVYDGFHSNWRQEEINLSDYVGKQLQFRFVLTTDNYMVEDGFYFDNFTISIVSELTGEAPDVSDQKLSLSDAFPNPVLHQLSIPYYFQSDHPQNCIEIFDVMGKPVLCRFVHHSSGLAIIDVSALKNGVYAYRLKGSSGTSTVRLFIKQ